MAKFIVNPGSAVHTVDASEFERLTRLPGFREATTEEIQSWYEQQGLPVPEEFSTQKLSALTDEASTTSDASHEPDKSSKPDTATGSTPKRARKNSRTDGI